MKVKTIKTYSLSEETPEKDIDKFIADAKKGRYQYDHRYGMEGLKTIKAYFRMIEDEYKKQNYPAARACYKKLLFLLLQSEHNYFGYEDIVGKMNFEKFIGNYFTCLIKLCSAEELFKEYMEYLEVKADYDFESAHRTMLTGLSEHALSNFASLVTKEAGNVGEEDYALYDMIYFLLDLANFRKDKEAYYQLCEKYRKLVGDEQKEEFGG